MKKNIILIGGAPTTGKSTMAQLLSKHFGIPWISTDQIRDIMRMVANRNEYPFLFTPEGYNAEKFLTKFSVEEIVDMEMKQADAVWPAVKKLIEEDYSWQDGFIIEGVNILPHLVARDFVNHQHVKAFFLFDDDEDRMRKVVFTRGLWDDAETYSDDVKEKEVEWASLFNQKIKKEAEKFDFSLVEVNKNSSDVQSILNAYERK